MASFPRPEEGIVLTHFVVSSDVARSQRFYAGADDEVREDDAFPGPREAGHR